MNADDWEYLVGLCDPYVLEKYQKALQQSPEDAAAEIAREEAEIAAREAERNAPRPILVMGMKHKAWEHLREVEREAATALGWSSQERWDREAMPLCTEKLWEELTDDEREAAMQLGFRGAVWDGDEDPNVPADSEAVMAFWLGLPDAPPRLVASVVHPQWRDSSVDNPWAVHLWPDGKFWKQDPRPKHTKSRARQEVKYSGKWYGSGGERGHDRLTLAWDGWPEEHWVSDDGGFCPRRRRRSVGAEVCLTRSALCQGGSATWARRTRGRRKASTPTSRTGCTTSEPRWARIRWRRRRWLRRRPRRCAEKRRCVLAQRGGAR